MNILYQDNRVLVCVKPAGVLSTDEPGGMPALLRAELGDAQACVRPVHRLDRPVSGVMVFARSKTADAILSAQVQSREFHKDYLAVLRGVPEQPEGELTDLLYRDRRTHTTLVVSEPGKDVQQARLFYRVLAVREGLALVRVQLLTGRTHQIRVQFSSRGLPLLGDRKYGDQTDCPLALWSFGVRFSHPQTGEPIGVQCLPVPNFPWDLFDFSTLFPGVATCNLKAATV